MLSVFTIFQSIVIATLLDNNGGGTDGASSSKLSLEALSTSFQEQRILFLQNLNDAIINATSSSLLWSETTEEEEKDPNSNDNDNEYLVAFTIRDGLSLTPIGKPPKGFHVYDYVDIHNPFQQEMRTRASVSASTLINSPYSLYHN